MDLIVYQVMAALFCVVFIFSASYYLGIGPTCAGSRPSPSMTVRRCSPLNEPQDVLGP